MAYLTEEAELIRSLVLPDERGPAENKDVYLLYALLMRTKGTATELEDVHDAWAVWTYGRDPGHESLRPFDELTEEVRELDRPYLEAIREAARRRRP